MVLGEFDFEEHFVYDKVTQVGGSQFSVQLMFILFIIQGSIIIANLITGLIVVNHKNAADYEMILARQRIEEIR